MATPPLWLPCERCGRAGSPSSDDPRFCATCLPTPAVARALEVRVDRRHQSARRAAARPANASILDGPPIAPDAEHIWRQVPPWRTAHLFADGKLLSYCRQAGFDRPTAVELDEPASQAARPCWTCWRSYRSGRRRRWAP